MAVSLPAVNNNVTMTCTAPDVDSVPNDKMESVTVVGVDEFPLEPVTSGLEEFFQNDGKAENLTYAVRSFTLPEEVDRGDFIGCSYVLLCDDLSTWSDESIAQQRTQRLCKCMKAAFRVNADVCIGLIGDPGDFRSHVTTLCQDYPEFRWLLCSGRLLNVVLNGDDWPLTATAIETLIAWLTVSGHTFEPQQLLDYRDMGQIIFRDLKEYIPEFMTFIRLGLLSMSGILGILVTGIILTAITHVPSDERSVRSGQLFLRRTLERQRLGKCEWEPGDDAMALMALQLDRPDWCFDTVENQRTIDRMEIHLLATLSRARHPTSRELTPVRLAQYINGLLTVYLNPKDFHGHDLVSLLEAHVLLQGRRQRQGPFSRSLSIIALYNSKVTLDWGHLSGLMALQKADGSFGYSIDETCLAIMALACGRAEPGVEEALNKSITWLAEKRSPEGAYGHTYSTALALQAFNVTGSRLPGNDWHVTMSWLLKQAKRDPAIRNIEIATQVLLVIAGRTMLSIRNFTGLGPGDGESYDIPRLLPHIYVDGNEGVPDGMQETHGLEDKPPEERDSAPELTKQPPGKRDSAPELTKPPPEEMAQTGDNDGNGGSGGARGEYGIGSSNGDDREGAGHTGGTNGDDVHGNNDEAGQTGSSRKSGVVQGNENDYSDDGDDDDGDDNDDDVDDKDDDEKENNDENGTDHEEETNEKMAVPS